MMAVAAVAAVVLSLLSAGQSAPLTGCESLIKPLENPSPDKMMGKWMYVGASSEMPGTEMLVKTVKSGWMYISTGCQNNTLNILQVQNRFGCCLRVTSTIAIENNTFHAGHPLRASQVLLNTGCPDCLLIQSKAIMGSKTLRSLELLSRRRNVTAAELEEYKKQVECLNLPSPHIMDPEIDVCPDLQPASQGSDITNYLASETGQKIRKLMVEVFNTEEAKIKLLDILNSTIAQLKEN